MAISKKELTVQANKLGIELDKSDTVKIINEKIEAASAITLEEEAVKNQQPEVAKAGKRSAKALKEAEDLAAKKERINNQTPAKPVKVIKPTRSKLERRAKAFRKSAEKIDATKTYSFSEAIVLAKTTSPVKFDATVEVHVNLNVDPRQADQNIRDIVILPAGSGKKVTVAVFTDDPKAALTAGADIAGNEEFLQLLDKGKMDFDVLISSPTLMAKLGKYARILGPRGLMPNPKSGTVTTDIAKAVKESKAGKIEYRVDSNGIVHLGVGKVSFDQSGLKDNILAVFSSIRTNKPSSVKSNYIKTVHFATSMGPSITVDPSTIE
jgi:large subunit ribosomal protein L1